MSLLRIPFAATPLALAAALALHAPGASAQATSASEAGAAGAGGTLGTVTVNASADASAEGLARPYAGGQVARGARTGVLGTQDIMETPFSTTAYTQELIENSQAQSIGDVLQYDPGVRVERGFGNFQQLYRIRGLPVLSDDIAYNGLYGLVPRQYMTTEFIERVEVFRGANSFVNGAGGGGGGLGGAGAGGAINLVPKRAPNEPLSRITAGVQTGGQGYVAADVARRFGPDQSTGIRVNAARRDGGTGVDSEKRELSLLAVGLDWRSSNVRLSADLGWQDHNLKQGRPSVTLGAGGVPAVPSASANYAQPWTFSKERDTFGTVRGEFDLNANTTAWLAAGARRGNESNMLANPATTNNATGATSAYRFDNVRKDDVATGEIGIRTRLQTGSVSHRLVASLARFKADSKNAYAFSDFAGFPSNLYNPVTVAPPASTFFVGGNLAAPLLTEQIKTSSIALADTLGFLDDRLLVTIGVRHQKLQNYSYDYNTGAQDAAYDASRTTPLAAVVYKLTPAVSVYGNYVEGLSRSPAAPFPATNIGQLFSPYVAKQKEIGVKYDGGSLGASAALFTLNQPYGEIGANGAYAITSQQRNRGLELTAFGQPVRGVKLLGGVNFLDAKVRGESATDGMRAIGVPKAQANVGVEWDVTAVRGLAVNARVVYTASQYADGANTQQIPAWTRFDAGLRYLTEFNGNLITLRGRVDNIANKRYWASAGGYPGAGYLVQGAPRTLTLTATVDF